MALKNNVLALLLALTAIGVNGQTIADVNKNINMVKRDTNYLYAEATMKDLDEAYNGACAILEMKVSDWVKSQNPEEGTDICIVKAKNHLVQLQTRRGDFYRAFVYVKKSDILPVADKSEVQIMEVAPVKQTAKIEPTPAIIVKEEMPAQAEEAPTIQLTPDEKQMVQVKNFYDVEAFIKSLKAKGRLSNYGKYSTMPANEDCHLFIYDKQGNIPALIRKTGAKQYNLNTLKEDNVTNYKNCGAIWLQLK